MKRMIHINQHVIKKNGKTGERNPPITVKTYKSNKYFHRVHIEGPCTVVYEPDNPLSCGAKVWIETDSRVGGLSHDYPDPMYAHRESALDQLDFLLQREEE